MIWDPIELEPGEAAYTLWLRVRVAGSKLNKSFEEMKHKMKQVLVDYVNALLILDWQDDVQRQKREAAAKANRDRAWPRLAPPVPVAELDEAEAATHEASANQRTQTPSEAWLKRVTHELNLTAAQSWPRLAEPEDEEVPVPAPTPREQWLARETQKLEDAINQ